MRNKSIVTKEEMIKAISKAIDSPVEIQDDRESGMKDIGEVSFSEGKFSYFYNGNGGEVLLHTVRMKSELYQQKVNREIAPAVRAEELEGCIQRCHSALNIEEVRNIIGIMQIANRTNKKEYSLKRAIERIKCDDDFEDMQVKKYEAGQYMFFVDSKEAGESWSVTVEAWMVNNTPQVSLVGNFMGRNVYCKEEIIGIILANLSLYY